jgi:hypothetical protein
MIVKETNNHLFDKNNMPLGLGLGLIVPFVGYALMISVFELLDKFELTSQYGLSMTFRTRTLIMISICFNIILLQLYKRKKYYETIRGIVFATMALAAVWVFYFWTDLVH